jgi:hypothetical protein
MDLMGRVPADIDPSTIKSLRELMRPEAEYYRLYSPPATPPTKGILLLVKDALNPTFKVFFANGEHMLFRWGKDIEFQMEKIGIPREKVTTMLDYLWNFRRIYVRHTDPEIEAPPIEDIEQFSKR